MRGSMPPVQIEAVINSAWQQASQAAEFMQQFDQLHLVIDGPPGENRVPWE
jgi:hypothetical protein